MAKIKHSGFSLAELMISLVVSGIIAIFLVPKVLTSNEDVKHKEAVRESFVVLGEAYLARKNDASVGTEDLSDGNEPTRFAQYLYKHLNYDTAIDPATVTLNDYCNTAQSYFVMPSGQTIQKICATATAPRDLRLQIMVPRRANSTSDATTYWLVLPEESGGTGKSQERYVTLYGKTGEPSDCTTADEILNTGC